MDRRQDKSQPSDPTAPAPPGPKAAPAADRHPATPPAPHELRPLWASDPASAIFAPIDSTPTMAVAGISASPGQITLPLPVPPLPAIPVTQLAPLAIAIATDPGTGALDVTLSPDELGRLHMHVMTDGDTLRIAMTVERPETLDLLRRHADQLLADLRQAGFGGATLSFGQGSAGDGRPTGATADHSQVPPADPVKPDPAPLPVFQRGQASGNAPLDLRL